VNNGETEVIVYHVKYIEWDLSTLDDDAEIETLPNELIIEIEDIYEREADYEIHARLSYVVGCCADLLSFKEVFRYQRATPRSETSTGDRVRHPVTEYVKATWANIFFGIAA
jgi:hypothetical protein